MKRLYTRLASLLALIFPATFFAATIEVTSTADSGTGSLREAILLANANDIIQFHSALDGIPILLDSMIEIATPLSIKGNGIKHTIIDGQAQDRIFRISAPGSNAVRIQNLTMRNGKTTLNGGAIRNSSFLYLKNVLILGNDGDFGGAIHNSKFLSCQGCVMSGNYANVGGGIFTTAASTTEILNSTISGNSLKNLASQTGGGLVNQGIAKIGNTIFAGNLDDGNAPDLGTAGANDTIIDLGNNLIGDTTGIEL